VFVSLRNVDIMHIQFVTILSIAPKAVFERRTTTSRHQRNNFPVVIGGSRVIARSFSFSEDLRDQIWVMLPPLVSSYEDTASLCDILLTEVCL
jgi:hypothetical protein